MSKSVETCYSWFSFLNFQAKGYLRASVIVYSLNLVCKLLSNSLSYSHECRRTNKYASMHAYIHACIHTCINAYVHTYIHTCIHAYVHTYIHTCIHASCIHACIRTYIRMYVCMYMHAYIQTHTKFSENGYGHAWFNNGQNMLIQNKNYASFLIVLIFNKFIV